MSFEKNSPSPLPDDRSTKKAKFRAQGDDGDNPTPISFRDKLMESHMNLEEEFLGQEEDLAFEPADIVLASADNIPSISFSEKIHAQLIRPWQHAVIVKLLGRPIGYRALCNRLDTMCSMTHGFSVIDLENNYFLVRFKLTSDVDYVLTQGPWTVLGHYLVVQRWSPSFDCTMEEIDSAIVWIRLPGMALHYYHKRVLRILGQLIGTVVRIDYNTESATRGKFARIAVEVALNKPLVSQFFLDGKIQKVEYESLPHICFICGKYGHFRELCPERSLDDNNQGVEAATVTDANSKGDAVDGIRSTSGINPKFGPWMVLTRKGKNRGVKESANLRDNGQGNWSSFGKASRYGC